jgi:sugar O-acyltransferase (sialic acid O-acetyltransferase NeuD family)
MYIYGASSHGKVVSSVVEALGKEMIGFIDDNESLNSFMGLTVNRRLSSIDAPAELVIAVGNNQQRREISQRVLANFVLLVHPKAYVHSSALIGLGSVIMAGACIQIDSKIGSHCILNTGCCIEHDCELGDFVHVSSNATIAGNVKVGEGAFIGAGATITPGVKIGKWSIVGAGAVVLNDVPEGATVVGVPSKEIHRQKQ